jgi:hypothetical protein
VLGPQTVVFGRGWFYESDVMADVGNNGAVMWF